MKKVLLMLAVLAVPSLLLADSIEPTRWIVAISSEQVSGTTNYVYSDAINISNGEDFGFAMIGYSTSTNINLTLEYQIIPSNQQYSLILDTHTGTIEGDLEWVSPTTGSTLVANYVSSDVWKADGFDPMVSKWLRFKIYGNSNNADTTSATVLMSIYGER